MIITLPATTTDEIVSVLLTQEGAAGSSRVLTLVIDTCAADLEDALTAAHGASRDHPSRVVAVVAPGDPRAGAGLPGTAVPPASTAHAGHDTGGGHLDAEVRLGHHAGAGETVVLRPFGEAARHTDTLVVPLLLPDVPVVTWWPGPFPAVPAQAPLGRLAHARITNTPAQADPAAALASLVAVHTPADTDLAWTRITLWRAMVASVLDPALRRQAVECVVVASEPGNSSVRLMAAWLHLRLGLPVSRTDVAGIRGIASITTRTTEGDITITRQDPDRVVITRPGRGQPEAVTMARREPVTTLNEELRRLAPDLVYQEVLASLEQGGKGEPR